MKRWTAALVILCAISLSAAAQNLRFRFLPSPTGPGFNNYSLSRDGRIVAINSNGEIFTWTEQGGFKDLGLGDVLNSSIGISADGSTVVAGRVGDDGATNAARWTQATGWKDLGHTPEACSLDNSWGSAYDVNRDGSIVVGLAWYCPGAEGFKWTQQNGMVGLGHPDRASSRASAISANGKVIVGFYEHPTQGFRRPVRWVNDSAADLFQGEDNPGEATAVSSNGKVIGGQVWDGAGTHAFVFTDQGGSVGLGTLSGRVNDQSIVNGISDKGVAVGFSGDFFTHGIQAFIWRAGAGMGSMQKFLVRNGANIPSNVTIDDALDISADGSTIIGTWFDTSFNSGAWIARIKPGTQLK